MEMLAVAWLRRACVVRPHVHQQLHLGWLRYLHRTVGAGRPLLMPMRRQGKQATN